MLLIMCNAFWVFFYKENKQFSPSVAIEDYSAFWLAIPHGAHAHCPLSESSGEAGVRATQRAARDQSSGFSLLPLHIADSRILKLVSLHDIITTSDHGKHDYIISSNRIFEDEGALCW